MKRERVIGRIPVLECLRARRRAAHKLYLLADAKDLIEIKRAAPHVPTEYLARKDLDKLAGGAVHQGVILEASPLPVLAVEEWLDKSPVPGDAIVVLLDGIEDPHNFGAIVRSAAACGAAAVVFGKDRAAPLSPVAVKAAAGGMEYVDLVQATNLGRAIETFQKNGFWVAGLDAEGAKLLWDADLTGRIVLVVGGEGKGIRRLVREKCDFLLRIPIVGAITSLNASVSAGIALAECLRQRQEK